MVQVLGNGIELGEIQLIMLMMFFAILIIQALNFSNNAIDDISTKILGYPKCDSKIGGLAYCFGPSQSELDSVIIPFSNFLGAFTKKDLVSIITGIVTSGLFGMPLITALFIMLRLFVLFGALSVIYKVADSYFSVPFLVSNKIIRFGD